MILSSSTENSYDEDDEELETPLSEEPPEAGQPSMRVRFRSRVRITSGLNRHRHHWKSYTDPQDYLTFTASSSISGSPSSSISAPLRTRAEDDIGKPGWGTLGQRVSLLAHGNDPKRKTRERRKSVLFAKSELRNHDLDERSPLITPAVRRLLQAEGHDQDFGSDQEDEESRLSREIDQAFGPWPHRLLNPHWWWWHMEPVVSCQCLSDSDDDEG